MHFNFLDSHEQLQLDTTETATLILECDNSISPSKCVEGAAGILTFKITLL